MHQGTFIDEDGKEYIAQILPKNKIIKEVKCECGVFYVRYTGKDLEESAKMMKQSLASHQQSVAGKLG